MRLTPRLTLTAGTALLVALLTAAGSSASSVRPT